jgi:hypothetical protein
VGLLNVIGDYAWSPRQTLPQEIALVRRGGWSPTSTDFATVAGRSTTCGTFGALLGHIAVQEKRTISGINIFTHGDRGVIAFGGVVKAREGSADVMLNVNGNQGAWTALDVAALDSLDERTVIVPGKPKAFSLDDLRDRFTGPNAVIFLYACHSAVDPELLQRIADTFGVQVRGFRSVIAYCPTFKDNPPSLDRSRIGIGSCAGAVSDFTKLPQNDVIMRIARPRAR